MSLSQLAQVDLNEREMCKLLGGGTSGDCQCGCHYEGEPGGLSISANDSANNAFGYSSDPQAGRVDIPRQPTWMYAQYDNLCH